MVNKRMQTLLTQLRQQGIRDEKLLRAIEAVPRERLSTKRWIIKPTKTLHYRSFRPDYFSALYGGADDRAAESEAYFTGA